MKTLLAFSKCVLSFKIDAKASILKLKTHSYQTPMAFERVFIIMASP
jgi:hypothetical protein